MVADAPVNIVFLDRATLPPEIHLRPFAFPHSLTIFEHTAPAEVAGRVTGADIVVSNKAPLRAEAIAGAARLRLIAVAATGTDMVDLAAAAARGIVVTNVRNYAVHTVP